jgi:hypothetical protein
MQKAEASKFVTLYSAGLLQRVADALATNARTGGSLGGVFGWSGLVKADADAANAALTAAGWTVVQDNVLFTLTVS